MALNLNTDLALITTNNPGNITLPLSTSIPGRVITFKDVLGTFGTNTLTLNTTGGDTFEDGGTTKVLSESYGYIQLVASSGKWFILNGTQVNTLQVSAMTSINISSLNISTASIGLSSLSFIDNRRSTNSLNVVSTFLTYNNFIISGTKVGYSGVLNTFRFSLFAIPNLTLWLDAADDTTVSRSGANVTAWRDKSGNGYNTSVGGVPTYTLAAQNGLNVITVNATQNFTTIQPFPLSILNQVSAFVVLVQTPLPAGNIEFFVALQNFTNFDMYFNNGGGILVNVNNSQTGILTNVTGVVSIYEFIYNGTSRTIYVDGLPVVSNTSIGFGLANTISQLRFLGGITGYGCECMYYSRAVRSSEREQIEGYLAWKWGIQSSLPASHPYRTAPP
jgi:hypothetical protein